MEYRLKGLIIGEVRLMGSPCLRHRYATHFLYFLCPVELALSGLAMSTSDSNL